MQVILREYYWGKPAEFFIDYAKKYTDFPFLVILDEKNGKYQPGRFLNAKDFGPKTNTPNLNIMSLMKFLIS